MKCITFGLWLTTQPQAVLKENLAKLLLGECGWVSICHPCASWMERQSVSGNCPSQIVLNWIWLGVVEVDGYWGAAYSPGTVNLHICGLPDISPVGVTFPLP